MLQYKMDIWMDSLERKIERVLEIVKYPENFILDRYYMSEVPKGFRIEIFAAKRFTSFCDNLRHFSETYIMSEDCMHKKEETISLSHIKKLRNTIWKRWQESNSRKTFCPYCEKLVIPKRLHRLDYGDIMVFLFTGGFWAIFLLVLYIFLRKCPICNYNLRGIK